MSEEIKEKIKTVEEGRPKRALLVSVYMGPKNLPLCEEHIDELELLCETFGLDIVGKIPCQIRQYDPATCVTSGKLEELIAESKRLKADVVVFDDEISPVQQRNLEELFGIAVIDRAEVILGVFAQRARTKEAKLQVEYAEMQYQAPRLKGMWTHLSRQRASSRGSGHTKGKGEKQIELDRRLIKKQKQMLQEEIDEVRANRQTQRVMRDKAGIPVFAIIGYTNAGKSTLLNALTDAGVFVEDKLFATLDTTTRKFTLDNHQEILLIDTVGFIRKLPHHLVAAFRSTLEEAVQADILLHLIDVSHPNADKHAEATFAVLKELNAENKPIITVLNKVDKCTDKIMINKLRITYPRTVQISALKREGFDHLIEKMQEELSKQRTTVSLRVPQSDYRVISDVINHGHVLSQDYEENDVLLRVELPSVMAARLQKYVV